MTATFPRTGYRSLREQIVAAAESIPFNIAEGCGASSQKEFARFLEISIKSANELEAELQLTLLLKTPHSVGLGHRAGGVGRSEFECRVSSL
jgi:four helix bundle protein